VGHFFVPIYKRTIKTIYHYDEVFVSAQKKETGELSILFELGLPVHLVSYMEICAFHLAHPTLSQWKVALEFQVSKFYVWKAYQLLNE
jgi:hypothetical protein